jgi:hypothetical protein
VVEEHDGGGKVLLRAKHGAGEWRELGEKLRMGENRRWREGVHRSDGGHDSESASERVVQRAIIGRQSTSAMT